MRMVVFIVAAALLVLVPLAVVLLGRRGLADFQRLLDERGFAALPDCPVKEPLGPGYRLSGCYEGQIQPGRKVTLFFVQRHVMTGKPGVYTYMGLHFPSSASPSEAFLKHWQERVAANQGKALPEDTHAERRPDGMVIARFGGPARAYAEKFLNEAREALDRYK